MCSTFEKPWRSRILIEKSGADFCLICPSATPADAQPLGVTKAGQMRLSCGGKFWSRTHKRVGCMDSTRSVEKIAGWSKKRTAADTQPARAGELAPTDCRNVRQPKVASVRWPTASGSGIEMCDAVGSATIPSSAVNRARRCPTEWRVSCSLSPRRGARRDAARVR